jgi:hypothetical protein
MQSEPRRDIGTPETVVLRKSAVLRLPHRHEDGEVDGAEIWHSICDYYMREEQNQTPFSGGIPKGTSRSLVPYSDHTEATWKLSRPVWSIRVFASVDCA